MTFSGCALGGTKRSEARGSGFRSPLGPLPSGRVYGLGTLNPKACWVFGFSPPS